MTRLFLRLPSLCMTTALFGVVIWSLGAADNAPREEVWFISIMVIAAYWLGFIQGRLTRGFFSKLEEHALAVSESKTEVAPAKAVEGEKICK